MTSTPIASDYGSARSRLTPAQGSVLNAVIDPARSDWLVEYPPPRSLPLDQEALRVYERAYALGILTQPATDPPITFGMVIMALLVGQDETSRWFSRLAIQNGPDARTIFAEYGVDIQTALTLSVPVGRPEQIRFSADKHLLTSSARAVIGNAEGWAQRVGGSDIGVRHLVASYVLNPPSAHRSQLQTWGYQETKWRSDFFDWIAERYTAEQWTDASLRPAPTKGLPSFEKVQVKGRAIAFPGDINTLGVLDRASQYHSRRDDPWLRLRTVLYALIETAREQEAVRTAVAPLWDAVNAASTQYSLAFTEYTAGLSASHIPLPFADLDISPRVLNALETARELALATRRDSHEMLQVGALHLAGALLSRRVDADDDLVTMGLSSQPLRGALISFAHALGEPIDLWREALGEEEAIQAGRPVELNSDEPEAVVRLDQNWASDPLAIRRGVETFAALLASKSLEPPLSIGLFGPWGSGKTTFLKRLRGAVEQRAREAQQAIAESRPSDYVSNVVHVDFNAWHFAESALTSSLVDTILRALSSYIRDEHVVAGKAWREQKLAALESTKRKVEAANAIESAARARVADAQAAEVTARQQAANALTSAQAILQEVWSETKKDVASSNLVKSSGVLDAVSGSVKSLEELRQRLMTLRARPARLLGDLGLTPTIIFSVLVLALPLGVAWLATRLFSTGEAMQLIAWLTGVLPIVTLWARAASRAVADVDQAISRVDAEYAKRVASDPKVLAAQSALVSAEANATTAAAGLSAARDELARAQAEAASAALPAQMLQLVSSRIEADTYTRELTSLSLARADLEALSRILRDQRAAESDSGAAPLASAVPVAAAPRAVDRVILYIDDLDRCKPEDVVRVLQLIHMLLAFELFVVVVAVDARWVEHALVQSYAWLSVVEDSKPPGGDGVLTTDAVLGSVTPQDYLEKIFQIAFWLEPMTAGRAASYLASLVRPSARETGPVLIPQIPVAPTSAPPDLLAPVPASNRVEIAAIELDYMRALAAYVGSSPRRVKRLVNAYRLIKAGMTDAQLATFLTDRAADDGGLRSGPYQIVIGLLVIATGASAASSPILQAIAEWDPGETLEVVVDEFRARNHPDWTMAAQVLETLMRTQRVSDVAEVRGWARKVRRFLLNRPPADGRPIAVSSPSQSTEIAQQVT